MTFYDLKISDTLVKKLQQQNIITPTPIQEKTIPKILKGESVIAQSKTGTGKTLAFLLPLLQIAESDTPSLILAPTKELAKQIHFVAKSLTFDNKKILLLTGGEEIDKQQENLKKHKPSIIIGVPGRIVKLIKTGYIKPSIIKRIVLDEVDFLIDLGFKEELEFIFSKLKKQIQVMTFAATLSQKTKAALDILRNQKYTVRITPQNTTAQDIINCFFPIGNENDERIDEDEKTKFLLKLLSVISPYLCIIFVRTKKVCDKIYSILKENNFLVSRLHGDLSPSERKNNIRNFTMVKTQYLVATDLAGRGIDIEGITHIINYNLPLNEIDYVHRAGRTGRMNTKGIVYSLCNRLDEAYLKKYAYNLDFTLIPLTIKNDKIIELKNYKGVKPRFNLEDIEKQKKINRKKYINNRRKQNDKKKRSKKRK